MSLDAIITSLVQRVGDIEERLDRLSSFETVPFNIGARVFNSANISVANSSNQYLTYDTEIFDTDNMHSLSTNTGRLTINTAGKYLLVANAAWAATSGGRRQINIDKNRTTQLAAQEIGSVADATANPAMLVIAVADLVVGDYVETRGFQTSGGALNISTFASWSPVFTAWRLG